MSIARFGKILTVWATLAAAFLVVSASAESKVRFIRLSEVQGVVQLDRNAGVMPQDVGLNRSEFQSGFCGGFKNVSFAVHVTPAGRELPAGVFGKFDGEREQTPWTQRDSSGGEDVQQIAQIAEDVAGQQKIESSGPLLERFQNVSDFQPIV